MIKKSHTSKVKKYKLNLYLMYGYSFFYEFKIYDVFLIIFLSTKLDSYAMGMSIIGARSISSSLMEIPTGMLSDKIARKTIIQMAALSLFAGVTTFYFGQHYYHYAIAAFLCGLSTALLNGTYSAFLYENLASLRAVKHFPEAYSKVESGSLFSLAIATLLSGFIPSESFELIFLFTLIPLSVALVISLFLEEPKRYKDSNVCSYAFFKKTFQKILRNKRIFYMTCANTLDWSLNHPLYIFRVELYKTLIPLPLIGILRTSAYFISGLLFFLSKHIIRYLGETKIMIHGELFITTVQLFGYSIANTITPLFTEIGLVLYPPIETAQETFFQKEFSADERATLSSIISLVASGTTAFVMVAIGYLADVTSPQTSCIIFSLLCFSIVYFRWKALNAKSA